MEIEEVVIKEVTGLEIVRNTLSKYMAMGTNNYEEVIDRETKEIVIRCTGVDEIDEYANITITIKNPEDVTYEVDKVDKVVIEDD